ncbi:MAG: flagellar protein FlgN [Bacilli bacterium]
MQTSILVDVLRRLCDVHKQLLETGVEKQTAIVEGNFNTFTEVVNKEQSLLAQLTQLEKRRTEEVYVLLTGRLFRGNTPTIKDCLPQLPVTEQMQVEAVCEELYAHILKLKQLNDLNLQLIKQSLQFTNMSLEIARPTPRLSNYSATGASRRPTTGSSSFNVNA